MKLSFFACLLAAVIANVTGCATSASKSASNAGHQRVEGLALASNEAASEVGWTVRPISDTP